MRDRTYYKNTLGEIYSVSPRIIESGIPPLNGFTKMNEEEKAIYLNKRLPSLSQEEPIDDLTPIQKRSLARAQKRLDKIEAEYQSKLREEEEKNKIFDTLTDEQLSLVEVLEDQGLSTKQIRDILETREAKIKERDEMVQYLSQLKD